MGSATWRGALHLSPCCRSARLPRPALSAPLCVLLLAFHVPFQQARHSLDQALQGCCISSCSSHCTGMRRGMLRCNRHESRHGAQETEAVS